MRDDVSAEAVQLVDVGLDDEQDVCHPGLSERSEILGDLVGRPVQGVGVGRAGMLIGEHVGPACGAVGLAGHAEDAFGAGCQSTSCGRGRGRGVGDVDVAGNGDVHRVERAGGEMVAVGGDPIGYVGREGVLVKDQVVPGCRRVDDR